MVVFPAPVVPTNASEPPGGMRKFTSYRSCCWEGWVKWPIDDDDNDDDHNDDDNHDNDADDADDDDAAADDADDADDDDDDDGEIRWWWIFGEFLCWWNEVGNDEWASGSPWLPGPMVALDPSTCFPLISTCFIIFWIS